MSSSVPFVAGGQETRAVIYPPADSLIDPVVGETTVIVAPGAGAGQQHHFVTRLALALTAHGLEVVTFDFPYIAAGRKRPDRLDVLERAWLDAIAFVRAGPSEPPPTTNRRLFIGGKSMGGRVATHVASAQPAAMLGISGVVCVGYPLNPPYRAEARSVAHLARIDVPVLVLQGTRDPFGGPDDVRRAAADAVRMDVIAVEGADHGFALTRRAGGPAATVHAGLAATVAAWMVRTGSTT